MNRPIATLLLLVMSCYCLVSCLSDAQKSLNIISMSADQFPYDFQKPILDLKLAKSLKEISGICFNDGNLLAIQDEAGILYELSTKTGEVIKERAFGHDHDYEGIALAAEQLYVLRADGTILALKNWQDLPTVDSFDTPLGVDNDAEGLCYEASTNSLLIACKGHANIDGTNDSNRRSIFRFSLATHQLNPKPAYIIHREAIAKYLAAQNPEAEGVAKMLKKLVEKTEELFIGPSDIAIHPMSKDIYIPASRGNCLLVLDAVSGAIKHCVYLSPEQFRQPEGICFDAQGRLYLASEGDGKKAKLFAFDMIVK
jgi:hypothetical protein